MDFLLSAYLQIGDDQKARAQMDALQKLPKSSMMRDYREYYDQAKYSFPATYALERKQWKEALSIHPDPADAPHTQVIAYWARAIAAGYLRDADSASGAVDQMLAAVEATKKSDKAYLVDFLDAAIKEAQAWSLHAKGQDEEALNLLRTAADLQDRVGKSETEIPAREMLADLLLEIGRSNEALTEFEASLQANPNRFNALYGAARAAELSNHSDKANQYYTQLLKNCSRDSERPELAQARKLAKQ
jgi:tetratricopeptide (TPR) repeat protein